MSIENVIDQLQGINYYHKELLLNEIVRLKAERDALQKRIDDGFRVGIYHGDFGFSVTFTENKLCNKFNATLILDEKL